MGSPASPSPETEVQEQSGTTSIDPLAESQRLASEFERAMQRHTQADYFAGIAEFEPIAQALLARVGRERFVRAVHEVRANKGEYFYDVICSLIPSAQERLQFYEPLLAGLQQEKTAVKTETVRASGNGTPHDPVRTEHQHIPLSERELFIHRCQSIDRILRFVPTQIAQRILVRFSPSGKAERQMEKNGCLLSANFNFVSIDPVQFDEPGLSEELRQSSDDLHRFRDTEGARISSELQLLSEQAKKAVRRLNEEIANVREQVYATFSERFAKLSHDLPILAASLRPSEEQPRSVLESTTGKAGQRTNIASVEREKRTLELAMEREIALQTEGLRRIRAAIPKMLLPSFSKNGQSQTEPTHAHGNGRPHSGSHKKNAPAPVMRAAK